MVVCLSRVMKPTGHGSTGQPALRNTPTERGMWKAEGDQRPGFAGLRMDDVTGEGGVFRCRAGLVLEDHAFGRDAHVDEELGGA